VKIRLDENLPARLVRLLAELGHDTDTVPQEGFAGKPDSDIWTAAQTAERFLITQDLDFSDIRRFTPGTHHGLLLVRLRAPGRDALAQRVQDLSDGGWSKPGNEPLLSSLIKLRVRRLKAGDT